jgi:hypothetical protein
VTKENIGFFAVFSTAGEMTEKRDKALEGCLVWTLNFHSANRTSTK